MNRSNKMHCIFLTTCLLWAVLLQMIIGTSLTSAAVVLPNHAPADFTEVRPDVQKGKLETITYSSKSIGVDRKAVIYTPPNYDPNKKIPGPLPDAWYRRKRDLG